MEIEGQRGHMFQVFYVTMHGRVLRPRNKSLKKISSVKGRKSEMSLSVFLKGSLQKVANNSCDVTKERSNMTEVCK